jgi:phosphotransferase system HPr (HPr) family protein
MNEPTVNPPDGADPKNCETGDGSCTITVTVADPMGLHLRTGKDVVRIASQFEAHITAKNLSRSSVDVDAKSILQLMQLQARKGHVLLLCAQGPDATDALHALSMLFL